MDDVGADADTRLEWWTGGDTTLVEPFAGPWRVHQGQTAGELFRVRTTAARPARLTVVHPVGGLVGDPTDLWQRATGPARAETLHGERVVATTDISAAGDLTTRTAQGATAEQLALHADALGAAQAARAAGVAAALTGLAAAGPSLAPALHAWFTACLARG
jgi:hypothetical protein